SRARAPDRPRARPGARLIRPHDRLERALDPGDRRLELVLVARLNDHLDLARAPGEARIRADEDVGKPLAGLHEHGDDPALAGAVAPSPRADWALRAQLVLEREKHRLHLRGQAGQHVDVLAREARRAAEGILERPAAGGA